MIKNIFSFKNFRNLQKQSSKFQNINTKQYYNFFGQSKKKKLTPEQEAFNSLNEQYKEFLQSQRFSIRDPFKKTHFITEQEREKQLKEIKSEFKDYMDIHKFDKELDQTAFQAILSKISYTYDNQVILEDTEFQQLLVETSEKCFQFTHLDNLCQFISFCAIQPIPNIDSVFECFSSHIQNNYKSFDMRQKLSILRSVNDRSYVELSRFFDVFENSFLEDVQISTQKVDLFNIIEILKLYRKYDKGSENFYFTLEGMIKSNLKEIKIPILINLIQYYSGSTKETITTRNEMMGLFEQSMINNIRFLTGQELIQTFFCYSKFGKGSDLFFKAIDQRIVLQIDSMTVQEVKQLLIIANYRPQSRLVVFLAAEEYIKKNIKKIPRQIIPEIFFYFSENNIGSKEFYEIMESKLIEFMFNIGPEQLSLCAWSFAVNSQTHKADLYFSKLEEILPMQISKSTIKDLSRIVWSSAKISINDESVIYSLIEEEINKRELTPKECAHVLWGYILNRPLQPQTLQKIVETIIEKREDLDSWDISTIIWSFSKFEQHQDFQFIFQILYEQTVELVDEMSSQEYLQVLRGYIETSNEQQELIDSVIERVEDDFMELQYDQIILLMHCLTGMQNVQITEQIKDLIIRLQKRAEEMVKLAVIEQEKEQEQAKIDLQDVDYYLDNEKLEEMKK